MSYSNRDRTKGMFNAQNSGIGGSANDEFIPSEGASTSTSSMNWGQMSVPLIAAIFILALATCGIVLQKKSDMTASRSYSQYNDYDYGYDQLDNRSYSNAYLADARDDYSRGWGSTERDFESERDYENSFGQQSSSVESRMNNLENQVKVWKDRTWKLAMANNENVSLRKRIDGKYHPYDNSNYMTFDRNWSINKWPETLNLSESQRSKLRNDVKVKPYSQRRPSTGGTYSYPSTGTIINGGTYSYPSTGGVHY